MRQIRQALRLHLEARLSYGQIARAIGHGPSVLFLDEPTAGLDPQSRLGLWDLVRELRAEGTMEELRERTGKRYPEDVFRAVIVPARIASPME